MINRLYKKLLSIIAPTFPLERELFYLKRAIKKTQKEIEYIYSLPIGSCCYYCAYPELYDLENKLYQQETRRSKLELINERLLYK